VVRPAEQPVNSSISIRGIGTFAFSISTEPSVAVQVDDVPVAFQARAFTNLTDIDRLEVLRGPQSTLYGKSASAGLLNIVTKDPTPTLTGRVGALATSDSEFQGNASLSGPLTDTLGFRASVNWDKFLGNVTNVTDGRRLSGREDFSARGKLKWTPTSDLTVHLGLDYVDGHTTLGQPFITISPDARLRGTRHSPRRFLRRASLPRLATAWSPMILSAARAITISSNRCAPAMISALPR
jgi:iron complex outermembrane receptor protein